MEVTLEKENPVEVTAPDEVGIGRRLRDRDLLRKRKAEAEEKATTQWVYGAQSRKRARREPSDTPGKKGRPRKTALAAEPPPDQAELQAACQPETPVQAEELVPGPAPHTASVSVSAPALTPQPPVPLSAPAPAPGGAIEEVLIEDLGPDEEEDKPEKLVIDQGACEDPDVGEAERNNAFSEPALTPPPAPTQHTYLPGNVL